MSRAVSKGFTLIELLLAMSFISVLLLAIAMTIIQIGTIYNRGMSLKEVNQTARDIGSDFQRELSSATAISVDTATSTDYVTYSAGGRACLGSYTYIWNTGKALTNNDSTLAGYQGDASRQVRFVKVPDSAKIYCAKSGTGALVNKDIRIVDIPMAEERLMSGDHNLNIHKFQLTSSAAVSDTTTGQQLYTLDYIIGSGNIDAMNSDQSACLNVGEPGSDLAFCNVQQFSLVIRAGSGV